MTRHTPSPTANAQDVTATFAVDDRGLFCRHCGRASWLHHRVIGAGNFCIVPASSQDVTATLTQQARALFVDQCQPGDRGSLERHGEKAAVAAILPLLEALDEVMRPYGIYDCFISEQMSNPRLPEFLATGRKIRAALAVDELACAA